MKLAEVGRIVWQPAGYWQYVDLLQYIGSEVHANAYAKFNIFLRIGFRGYMCLIARNLLSLVLLRKIYFYLYNITRYIYGLGAYLGATRTLGKSIIVCWP